MTTSTLDRWLVAGTPGDQPYPCRCEEPDRDPAAWKVERARKTGETTVYLCDPYISKRGKDAGQWVNRCPCWGDKPEGKPDGCCAHSPHNPRLRVVLDGVVVGQTAPLPVTREAGWRAPHERAERPIIDVDLDPLDSYAEALGMPRDTPGPSELGPYVRRWTDAELHCACPTPWDHLVTRDRDGKRKASPGVGVHCPECCQNFRNLAASIMHQTTVLHKCKTMETARNVDGGQLLPARVVGGFVVWG